MSDENARNYDDIINLPHHVSSKHPPMPAADRAAQFAPFAALTGFGAVITETGRLTDEQIELDESERAAIDEKLNLIRKRLAGRPATAITYYQPDEKKAGGAYVTLTGEVRKIDETECAVIMSDGRRIPIDAIAAIEIE